MRDKKSAMGFIFGRTAHDDDCVWNDLCDEILCKCSDFGWKVFRRVRILS